MIKEIKYNGYTANPSDYDCPDGDLATSIGTVLEDGALHPLMQPSVVYDTFDAVNGYGTVLYVHETAGPRFYIVQRGNALYAETTDKQYRHSVHSFSGEDIKQVTAVGNTLIVLTDKAMHYLLWKSFGSQHGSYLYLGTKIPECPISFGLQGEMIRSDVFTISFDSMRVPGKGFSESNKVKITEQVLAKVNKFIAEESTNKGKFMFPFLIRYAYRLYDGSLVMHSSPILMIASSGVTPHVIWEGDPTTSSLNFTEAPLRVCAPVHDIDYNIEPYKEDLLNELRNWKDIVRSVDVFISKPIYTYDQNGMCSAFVTRLGSVVPGTSIRMDDSFCVCKHINQAASTSKYLPRYQFNTFNKLYAFTFNPDSLASPVCHMVIPGKSSSEIIEDICTTSQFYFLKSIDIETLNFSKTRTKIEVNAEYLQSLVSREVMIDDYDSHDRLIPSYAFPYNARLNLANIKKELYNNFYVGGLFPYTDGYCDADDYLENSKLVKKVDVYFYIRQDGKDIIVKGDGGYYYAKKKSLFLYLYYPNINAYKAFIKTNYNERFEYTLKPHPFLNGAFYFAGWDNPKESPDSTIPQISNLDERTVSLPNKIYTSEINNPFQFPVLGINTVGTGTILGISSAAKALSEGQFGQFPLYAFTTEGVWALEVSPTGTYSAKQPVTRDVCVSPHSITQIDSAVLFATARGIMHLSGSTAQCISEAVNSETPFHLPSLPSSDALQDIFHSRADFSNTSHRNFVLQPFSVFLSGCRMIYDYIHQHIIVYNPGYRYAYVYSLKSQAWGMMYSSISSSVPSYPEALAMDSLHRLVDFSLTDAEKETVLVITRPFKMGEPDVHKTVDTVIQRGFFKSGNMAQVLYGSNDLYSWHTVWSSADKYMRGFHGTPYKAFRLALICTLSKGESLFGCSLQFTPRMVNRLR